LALSDRNSGGDAAIRGGGRGRAGAIRSRAQDPSSGMTSKDPAAADLERSSEGWLAWLAREMARRQHPPGSDLLVLWDVLEEWFASDDFAGSAVAAAVAAPPDGRGPAANAALVRHRQATRRLLEDQARAAGAAVPAALALQLLTLVEGAIAGALIDRHPGAARHARELTRIALASATTASSAATWAESRGPGTR
jgi:hypothetical protein